MIPQLLRSFETTIGFVEKSVADLSEQEMVEQPPGVPNHAAWTLGHIIFSCQGVAMELDQQAWLPEDWESAFGYGSTPLPDVSRYPKKPEMLTLLADASHRLCDSIRALDASELQQSLPDETFPTMAHLLVQIVGGHTAYHAGQLAVWRRAIGKPSAEVFV